MRLADAYVDRIDFLRYLPRIDCGDCGAKTCIEFVAALKAGQKKAEQCPGVARELYDAFDIALGADRLLPKFPCLTAPRPGPVGLVEINTPDANSPILISGNNVHTQNVLASILGTTKSPFFVLFANTRGDTVDMAVILGSLTPAGITMGMIDSGIPGRISDHEIVIPGLARAMRHDLTKTRRWKIHVGPVCAAELPLFFGARWLPAD
jgi:CO dehydrogenase/acetyl-CoA synthase gamma subunit (corrinoid Fe-S protein)